MEQGPTEQAIITQCIRNGKPLPRTIANAPELWLGLGLFYEAFSDLTTERSFGFGEGPIPWSAVRLWCREHGVIGDQLEDMHYHIAKLDSVYLDYRAKQAKKAQTAPPDGPKIIRPQDAGSGPRGHRQR